MKKEQHTIEKVYQKLGEAMSITNPHAIPRVTKIVVNVGVGKARDNKEHVEAVRRDLAAITGQAPSERRARKAVAGFNVRQGNLVGYTVTLRGQRMDDFLQRFVHVTLPRVRDFRGLSKTSFDGRGNLSVGLREHLAFPEIHTDQTDVIFGVEVTFVTSTDTDEAAEQMFLALGFPFRTDAQQEDVILETAADAARKSQGT